MVREVKINQAGDMLREGSKKMGVWEMTARPRFVHSECAVALHEARAFSDLTLVPKTICCPGHCTVNL